jgi:peptidoglycan/xylan/chitin deacetylase (PgdA/CDA1 family)
MLGATASAAERAVAVTFDDLPGTTVSLVSSDVPALRETTRKLLAAFQEAKVPVVGFVNEGKLFVEDETPAVAEQRIDVLRQWLAAGHELGNHTYSHRDLNTQPSTGSSRTSCAARRLTRRLLARSSARFATSAIRSCTSASSSRSGAPSRRSWPGAATPIAPVTIDNDEYIYAAGYADALRRGDTAVARRLGDDYLRYMESVFAFIEDVSQRLLGRELPQVLLLHANDLNADRFPALAAMMKARGYRFVTLEEALRDEGLPPGPTPMSGSGASRGCTTGRSRKGGSAPRPPIRRTGW